MPLYDHLAIHLIRSQTVAESFKDHFNYRHLITNKFTLNFLHTQTTTRKTGALEHKSEIISHTK